MTDPGTDVVLMSRQERAIAARDSIEGGSRPAALVPRTFLEAQAFCGALATSDLIPQKLKDRAPDILVIVLAGIEVGLAPMQSIRMHHVINGVPRLSADGIAAIVMASPVCEYLEFVESTDQRSTWRTKRRGRGEQTLTWTMERAKRAGLLTDPRSKDRWLAYPEDMLNARCKAQLCRLVYPDVVGGLVSREEAYDGAIDVEWTEAPRSTFAAPPPPTPAPTQTAPMPAIVPAEAPKRGPGRPPKDRTIDAVSTEAQPAAKLDAAIAKVADKAQVIAAPPPPPARTPEPEPEPEPERIPLPEPPPETTNGAPAAPDPTWGEDPLDTQPAPQSLAGFKAWLASCRTQAELTAGKGQWLQWCNRTYPQGSPEARDMQKEFAARKAQVPA